MYFSFLFLAARVLEDCGAERQPCSGALWEGGHQYTWQWIPHRKVRAIFKVSSPRVFSPHGIFDVFCKTVVLTFSNRKATNIWYPWE